MAGPYTATGVSIMAEKSVQRVVIVFYFSNANCS